MSGHDFSRAAKRASGEYNTPQASEERAAAPPQVPGDDEPHARSAFAGCPRCLAFGHLGVWRTLDPSIKFGCSIHRALCDGWDTTNPERAAPLPGRPILADHFPSQAHNQSMNTLSSRVVLSPSVPQSLSPLVPQSLSPSVPRSLSPSVPWSLLYPHPPLWKTPGILRSITRNTHRINQFTFLSVNYPVNFNPEKRPVFRSKVAAWEAKGLLFRHFRALRLRPLDKCRPQARPYRAPSIANFAMGGIPRPPCA